MNEDSFLWYDRITDTLMYLSSNFSLEFVVNFASKKKDGGRSFFHSEFTKQSQYYNIDISKTIRRVHRYYYVISQKNTFGGGFVMRHSDVFILTNAFENKIMPWFFGKTRIFDIVEDRLVIKGKYEIFMYPQSEYSYLSIAPLVREFENGQYKEGVRIFVNDQDQYFDLTLDNFLGFYHILKNTDMVTLASTMMNYVKTQPYDVNTSSMNPGLGSGMNMEENVRGSYRNASGGLGASNFLNSTKSNKE